jgi:hypothetical protein
LRLRTFIEADTTMGRNPSAPRIVAMDRLSVPLDESQIGTPLRSNDIFGFTLEQGGVDFDNSPLFDLVVEESRMPELDLHFKFALTCENEGLVGQALTSISLVDFDPIGRLRKVKSLEALHPGTDVGRPVSVPIFTVNPVFQVASDILNNVEFEYPADEPKLEIFLYEVAKGVDPRDVMDGLEYARFPASEKAPVAYPPSMPPLVPGHQYAWRARAFLRGPESEYRYSNALYFHVDQRLDGKPIQEGEAILSDLKSFADQVRYGDDYVKRVLAALKLILGENFEIFELTKAEKIPAKGQIRLNGQPYTLEELERLAREFHQSKHSVTRLRFR